MKSGASPVAWGEFKTALPIALGFVIIFALLQQAGIVSLAGSHTISYGAIFLIGFVASISTCMAVVGGLVLSMSATLAREGGRARPQVLFHISRLIAFFILGGVIGAIGTAFTLSVSATFVLNLLVALVMLVLGIKLLNVFQFAKKIRISLPASVSRHAEKVAGVEHALTPVLFGIITFFLPCGFTQSMQLYTLTTGSFLKGGLTMLAFALGTFPVLALISFTSQSVHNSPKAGTFFKTAGLIVIFFALFNLATSFVAVGLVTLPRLHSSEPATASNVSITDGVQVILIQVKDGYSPRVTTAQAGIPTILRFDTENTFDCSSSVRVPSLGVAKTLPQTGTTDINIGTPQAGPLQGMCGMGMYPFEIDFQE